MKAKHVFVKGVLFTGTLWGFLGLDAPSFGWSVPTVFKSTDWGTSWTPTALADVSVNAIAVDPTDAQRVYVGTTAGVFSSTDGGATWNPSGWPTWNVLDLAVHPTSPCNLYVGGTNQSGTQTYASISTNCAASWSLLQTAVPGPGGPWGCGPLSQSWIQQSCSALKQCPQALTRKLASALLVPLH